MGLLPGHGPVCRRAAVAYYQRLYSKFFESGEAPPAKAGGNVFAPVWCEKNFGIGCIWLAAKPEALATSN
jgi:hypothetical protein